MGCWAYPSEHEVDSCAVSWPILTSLYEVVLWCEQADVKCEDSERRERVDAVDFV